MVGILRIHGGRPLQGSVAVSGAKNAVLPLLAACVAQSGCYRLEHCPHLTDVDATLDILSHLGCRVRWDGDAIEVDSRSVDCARIPREKMRRLRSSVIFLGALLARCSRAKLWLPGGCCIGARPIDLHLKAMKQLGAEVELQGDEVRCTVSRLQGDTVVLPFPSVGATENILLAALGCREGVTVLNAAKEPEVVSLAQFLRATGAKVWGEGTGEIHLMPGTPKQDTVFSVMPDRIEAATYLCALAACGGKICLEGAEAKHLLPVLDALGEAGVHLRVEQNRIEAKCRATRAVKALRTGPYPGFPTDAQAPMMAALLRARGTSCLEETVFEHRFRHVKALRDMGANIDIQGQTAIITGVRCLHGADMAATDLRGGAAMVIAALSAEGVSRIRETKHIFRGYDGLCQKLSGLGARICLREG